MIKFLPSATEKLNTWEENMGQGHCIHIPKHGSSGLLAGCCFRSELPVKKYEVWMLENYQLENYQWGGL